METTTTTTTHRKAAWGLAPTDETRIHWGARAIWKGRAIDLPFDRMDFVTNGATVDECKALNRWIHRAISSLVAQLDAAAIFLSPTERREIVIAGDGYRLRVNPNGSHGYLYMIAEHDDGEPEGPAERFPMVFPAPVKPARRSRSAR